MKRYQVNIKVDEKRRVIEVVQVSTFFHLEQWPGEGGWRIIHSPSSMRLTNNRFLSENDAAEFIDGFTKVYSDADLGFKTPEEWLQISHNTPKRQWLCRLLSALSLDPYAQAVVSMGDIRSISGRLKHANIG